MTSSHIHCSGKSSTGYGANARDEIGGDFEYDDIDFQQPQGCVRPNVSSWIQTLVESSQAPAFGRTAIHQVFTMIMASNDAASSLTVYLPSYCCDSMVEPIVELGCTVLFYRVSRTADGKLEYEIDINAPIDVFVAMSYFGCGQSVMDHYVRAFSDLGITVVEDATHRMMSDVPFCPEANYVVASLRKWFPIASGAVAFSQAAETISLVTGPKSRPYRAAEHVAAMNAKTKYLNGGDPALKAQFMDQFARIKREFGRCYRDLTMDGFSRSLIATTDIDGVRSRRRKNFCILLDAVSEMKLVSPLLDRWDLRRDTPLFLPLYITPNRRDELVNYLVGSRIFTPVHWPQPRLLPAKMRSESVYSSQISLVCDQRYGHSDMTRVVRVLREFEAYHG